MTELLALAREKGLVVIEDAAQAHGARSTASGWGVSGSRALQLSSE